MSNVLLPILAGMNMKRFCSVVLIVLSPILTQGQATWSTCTIGGGSGGGGITNNLTDTFIPVWKQSTTSFENSYFRQTNNQVVTGPYAAETFEFNPTPSGANVALASPAVSYNGKHANIQFNTIPGANAYTQLAMQVMDTNDLIHRLSFTAGTNRTEIYADRNNGTIVGMDMFPDLPRIRAYTQIPYEFNTFDQQTNNTGPFLSVKNGSDFLFKIQNDAVFPNDATKYFDGTGHWSTPPGGGGGVTMCSGTLTNYLLYWFNGICLTNSLAAITSTGISVPEVDTINLVVTNLNDGAIIAKSHVVTNVPPAVGYFHFDGANYGWSSSPATITSGFYGGITNGDFLVGDSYADVVFANAITTNTMQTATLPSGTYLITVMLTWNTYRVSGEQLHVQLFNSETGNPVDLSHRLVGPNVTTSVYGEWPVLLQSLITITTSGKLTVQARNEVAGDTQTQVRSDQSTISWIKTS